MKTRTKIQYVPTVLLDNVLAIKVKQHKNRVNAKSPPQSRKVVMYKSISTAEWKEKEKARIATEARLKVFREKPKCKCYYYQNVTKKQLATKPTIPLTDAKQ